MGPLGILGTHGFCPFCIAIKSASSIGRIHKHIGNGALTEEIPPFILTDPIELTRWLYNNIDENFKSFSLNATANAFIPVAVIMNTPVCAWHLWAETEPNGGRLLPHISYRR